MIKIKDRYFSFQPLISQNGSVVLHSVTKNIYKNNILSTILLPQLTASSFTTSSYYLGGKTGEIYISKDKGTTWTSASLPVSEKVVSIVQSTSKVYVGTEQGKLYQKPQTGGSWSQVTGTQTGVAISNMGVSTTGLYASQGNMVYTWNLPSMTLQTPAMQLTEAVQGMEVNADGFGIMVTTSSVYRLGSGVWLAVKADDDNIEEKGTGLPVLASGTTYVGVSFIDSKTGYITTSNQHYYKTVDGGQTWQALEQGPTLSHPLAAPGAPQKILAEMGSENQTMVQNVYGEVIVLEERNLVESSRMWYDELGRLVLSQNSRQQHIMKYLSATEKASLPYLWPTPEAYSYTLYDEIGRIKEVGELITNSQPNTTLEEYRINYANHESFVTGASIRREVTRTQYDVASEQTPQAIQANQKNLRTRVSTITYTKLLNKTNPTSYTNATHYTYDIHGNVNMMWQEMEGLPIKTIAYDYDLVSGKVNQVTYQPNQTDQFIHKYTYDGDNRIVQTETSRDGIVWDRDAKYEYYAHGPLARTTLGTNEVETQDFAYTIQGWIKGMTGTNYSYALGYFSGDYQRITTTTLTNEPKATPIVAGRDLYNGNIATMASVTPYFETHDDKYSPTRNADFTQQFTYDQLNRITYSQLVGNTTSYATHYSFDANGNILTLQRNDYAGTTIDDLSYRYHTTANGYNRNNNQLMRVMDGAGATTREDDFEQSAQASEQDDYQYDEIGNLIKDASEEINQITWNVSGKITSVIRTSGSDKANLYFTYDAMGNRVEKKVVSALGEEKKTYYLRDAQGNVMAVYTQNSNATTLSELHVYGSSRIGMLEPSNLAQEGTHILGLKSYEVTDHLGNVHVTISDLKVNNAVVVVSAMEYYAYGMIAKKGGEDATYGYNGQERETELNESITSAEFWMYDGRLGRRWNIDPVVKPLESSYACLNNSPIRILDPNGDDGYVDEDGNLLGDDGDKISHETRVINKAVWEKTIGKDKAGKLNAITDESRKALQTNIGTDKNGKTIGASKLLKEYEKGISISDATWEKLTDNGGGKLVPFVENNTSQTVYYKPEGNTNYVQYNGAYPIGPHKDLYSPVDSVNSTTIDPQKVYKVPTGKGVVIDNSGPDIINFLENGTFGVYGERDAPDESWYALRDCFNHLPSRAPKK